MRSIESNKKDFGIYWSESFSIDDYVYGNIKIRIGDRLYPENNDSYDNYTLCTVFFNLKDSFIINTIMAVVQMKILVKLNLMP